MRSTVATFCRCRILFISSDSQAATERCVYGETIPFLHFLNQSTACLTASISKPIEEETPSPQAHRVWKNLKTKTEDNKVRQQRTHTFTRRGESMGKVRSSPQLCTLWLSFFFLRPSPPLLSQQLWFLYSTSLAPFLHSTNGPSGLHPTYQASPLNELESESKKKKQ